MTYGLIRLQPYALCRCISTLVQRPKSERAASAVQRVDACAKLGFPQHKLIAAPALEPPYTLARLRVLSIGHGVDVDLLDTRRAHRCLAHRCRACVGVEPPPGLGLPHSLPSALDPPKRVAPLGISERRASPAAACRDGAGAVRMVEPREVLVCSADLVSRRVGLDSKDLVRRCGVSIVLAALACTPHKGGAAVGYFSVRCVSRSACGVLLCGVRHTCSVCWFLWSTAECQ